LQKSGKLADVPPANAQQVFVPCDNHNRLEWLYWLRSAKLCAVHNAQSGNLSGAKNLCAVVNLLAAHTSSKTHYFWLSAQW
jgi:hypothetical protein